MKILRGMKVALGFLLTAVMVFLVFLILVIEVLLNGPSVSAREIFVRSCNETSALKFLPRWFIGDAATDRILDPAPMMEVVDSFEELPYDTGAAARGTAEAGTAAEAPEAAAEAALEPITVEDIRGATWRGKLMVVADPHRVIVGTLKSYGPGLAGKYLPDFIKDYGAVGGTNAGGFEDPDGHGAGGCPEGIVIDDGEIRYGSPGAMYHNVMGFDRDGTLHVGNMTGAQALEQGIVNGVSFTPGDALVRNGRPEELSQSGINPRTALGQRADGAVLLVVIEGRHAGSLGATYQDVRDVMVEHGAVTAALLDGGTSSTMYYDGEQITRGSNLIGMRRLPTTILVMPEERAG